MTFDPQKIFTEIFNDKSLAPMKIKMDASDNDVERRPSGSIELDYLLGGGWPAGRIIEIFGAESNGKTSLVLATLGFQQRLNPESISMFVDAEESLIPAWAKRLGVDMSRIATPHFSCSEDIFNGIINILDTNKKYPFDFIVIDSLAAMKPGKMTNVSDKHVALQARLNTQFVSIVPALLRERGTTLILINQLRDNITSQPHAPREIVPGGRAVKFASSIRIRLNKGSALTDEKTGEIQGHQFKVKIYKNKTAPVRPEGLVDVRLSGDGGTGGFDIVPEMVRIGREIGVLTRPDGTTFEKGTKGSPKIYLGEIEIGASKARAEETLYADEGLRQKLYDAIQDHYNHTESVQYEIIEDEDEYEQDDDTPISIE